MGIGRILFFAIALRSASLLAGSPWTITADGRAVSASTATLAAVVSDGTVTSIESRAGGPSLFVVAPGSAALPALADARGLFPVDGATRFECAEVPAGARISMRDLSGDASAETVLDLAVGKDGDLIVRQSTRRDDATLEELPSE